MTTFPIAGLFRAAMVARPEAPVLDECKTPFGYACEQAFNTGIIAALATQLACQVGADPRASIAIEAPLRWHTSERDRGGPAILAGDTRGDLLLVVACCVVPAASVYQKFRERFTTQPIAALISPQPDEPAQQVNSTSTASTSQTTKASEPTPVDDADNSDDDDNADGSDVDDNADNSDDVPLAAMAPEPKNVPVSMVRNVAPDVLHAPAELDDELLAWQRDCLVRKLYRLNIVVRGYVSGRVVASGPRFACAGPRGGIIAPTGVADIVIIHRSGIFSSANAALEHIPRGARMTDPDIVISRRRDVALETPTKLPTQDDGGDNGDESAASERTQSPLSAVVDDLVAPPEEVEPAQIDHPRPAHLLDRLEWLDLSRLTAYEVDTAMRDRFSTLAWTRARNAHDNVPYDSSSARYPRGYRAPVCRVGSRLGLLGVATPYDYAAVGLAALCVAAKTNAEFCAWFQAAELEFVGPRARHAHAVHGVRVREQIEKAQPATGGYAQLIERFLNDALRVIRSVAEYDAEASAEAPLNEE